MDRRILLSLGLLGAGTGVLAQEKPNIVLFLVDDMGLMDTSVPFLTDRSGNPVRYPLNTWYRTPGMERLAAQGVRFSQFYAQGVSSPSRASLLTGQDAARHGVTNWIRSEENNRDDYGPWDWNWEGLRQGGGLLPEILQEAGYRTIHVGKGHFGPFGSEGENPLHLGFDVNVAGSSIGEPGSYLGENGYGLIRGVRSRAVPGLEKYHGTDTFLTEALTLEALAQVDTAVAVGKPFFLYLSHYAVHNPFEIDKRFIGHYPEADSCRFAWSREVPARGYATLIEGMDKSLGDVLDHLEALGVAENTLVIFLGDNGSDAPLGGGHDIGSSAPLRGKKGSEFEGGTRVPCIIAWARPDRRNRLQKHLPVRSGILSSRVGTIMDLYPTIAGAAGASLPETHPLDGRDLSPLLTGTADEGRNLPPDLKGTTDEGRDGLPDYGPGSGSGDTFLCHFPHRHRGSYFTTWRHGPWKLIYYYNPEHPDYPQCLLFNLDDDPSESRNLLSPGPTSGDIGISPGNTGPTTTVTGNSPRDTGPLPAGRSSEHRAIARRLLGEMIARLTAEGASYPVDFEGNPVPPRMDAIR